jgi:hypothetical protein
MPFLELRDSLADHRGRPQKCLAQREKEIHWAISTFPKRLGQRGASLFEARCGGKSNPVEDFSHSARAITRALAPTRRTSQQFVQAQCATFDNRKNAA